MFSNNTNKCLSCGSNDWKYYLTGYFNEELFMCTKCGQIASDTMYNFKYYK